MQMGIRLFKWTIQRILHIHEYLLYIALYSILYMFSYL